MTDRFPSPVKQGGCSGLEVSPGVLGNPFPVLLEQSGMKSTGTALTEEDSICLALVPPGEAGHDTGEHTLNPQTRTQVGPLLTAWQTCLRPPTRQQALRDAGDRRDGQAGGRKDVLQQPQASQR